MRKDPPERGLQAMPARTCTHCLRDVTTHIGDQRACLFESTTFQPMTVAQYHSAGIVLEVFKKALESR